MNIMDKEQQLIDQEISEALSEDSEYTSLTQEQKDKVIQDLNNLLKHTLKDIPRSE